MNANKDESTRPDGLDHELLLSVVDGDAQLLRLICGLFLRSYPALISELHDSVARNDAEAVARAAHTLNGSAGHFITNSARTMLTELERIAQSGDLAGAAARLVGLEEEIERLKPELSRIGEEDAETHD